MSAPIHVIDGARTPFLKARSGPGPFTPVDLAVQCGRPLLARQPFAPSAFDQVILGCVNVIADEMNPARVAALRLGMGEKMVAFTVQINCGSGMQSIDTAYRYIREGVSDLILAGGAEALSHAPLVWPQQGVRWFAGLAGAGALARGRVVEAQLGPLQTGPPPWNNGVGGLTALVQVVIASMVTPRERGRYSGYIGAVFALATVSGPLIGGVIGIVVGLATRGRLSARKCKGFSVCYQFLVWTKVYSLASRVFC